MIDSPYRIAAGQKLDLAKFSTDDTGPFTTKAQAKPLIKKNLKRLIELQELLFASSKYALLIVLQAMDAGGKDGAISHVFSGVNPQGCDVTSFKAPSHLELAHDYLWRYHMAAPKRGMIGIFNRSHYESVLVERVKKIAPHEVWKERYRQLNEFESILASENTVILKFFLHISKQEQRRRLQARLDDKSRHWKFSLDDLETRKHWNKYQEAFGDAIQKCSTKEAPWFVVPSDHKWFRNWVLSDTIVRTLAGLKMEYPPAVKGLGKVRIK